MYKLVCIKRNYLLGENAKKYFIRPKIKLWFIGREKRSLEFIRSTFQRIFNPVLNYVGCDSVFKALIDWIVK